MKNRLFLLHCILPFLVLFLIACSPEKRLARLVDLHPELKQSDTITIRDTISIPMIQADTVLHIDSLFDTVIIEKDRLQVSVLRLHDTLYLQGKCKADTVIIEKKVPVETIVTVKPDRVDKLITRLPWLVISFIALVLLVLFLLQSFKRLKK
ncbi:hypothetical protein D4S03_08490 [bacterium]|nr:MAG: hypothetical protein D4S03_08490 [bacterium]